MSQLETIGAKPGLLGATMCTYSGRYFDFLNPQFEQIHILDIAWALSMTCRFGGHCRQFYSVAQHSVLASLLVPQEHAMAALLHDAPEAYTGDVVGPLKQLLPDFKEVEHRIEAVVLANFGITLPLHPCIKHADLRMLRTEQRDLTAAAKHEWNGLSAYPPMDEPIQPLSQTEAFELFTNRYFELMAA